jgi:putative glutamine amidotransferase
MPTGTGKPVIGISTIDDHDAAGMHAPRFSLNQSYAKAVEAAGGIPILIPQIEEVDSLRRVYDMLDGIMLPGGLDIHPRYYAQEPHPALDSTLWRRRFCRGHSRTTCRCSASAGASRC